MVQICHTYFLKQSLFETSEALQKPKEKKKIEKTLFHWYSWNSEVETTRNSLIGWRHRTSTRHYVNLQSTKVSLGGIDFPTENLSTFASLSWKFNNLYYHKKAMFEFTILYWFRLMLWQWTYKHPLYCAKKSFLNTYACPFVIQGVSFGYDLK